MSITRDDLHDVRDVLSQRMDKGFDAITERLDTLNGRTRSNEQAIAVLQDRQGQVSKSQAVWAGSIGALIASIAEAIHWYVSSGGKP